MKTTTTTETVKVVKEANSVFGGLIAITCCGYQKALNK